MNRAHYNATCVRFSRPLRCFWLTSRLQSSREPIYGGKRVSYWARQSRHAVVDDSVRVLRQMGSLAIPYLTNQLTLKDGPLQKSWLWIWPRLPTAVRARIPTDWIAVAVNCLEIEPSPSATQNSSHKYPKHRIRPFLGFPSSDTLGCFITHILTFISIRHQKSLP